MLVKWIRQNWTERPQIPPTSPDDKWALFTSTRRRRKLLSFCRQENSSFRSRGRKAGKASIESQKKKWRSSDNLATDPSSLIGTSISRLSLLLGFLKIRRPMASMGMIDTPTSLFYIIVSRHHTGMMQAAASVVAIFQKQKKKKEKRTVLKIASCVWRAVSSRALPLLWRAAPTVIWRKNSNAEFREWLDVTRGWKQINLKGWRVGLGAQCSAPAVEET